MRATWLSDVILLDVIILMIFGKEYLLYISSRKSFSTSFSPLNLDLHTFIQRSGLL
jgi:hypothetical protein